MIKQLSRLLLAFMLISVTFFIVPAQDAEAEWQGLELSVSQYTEDYVYVPGESMEIILKGDSGPFYTVWIVTPSGEEKEHRSVVQIGKGGIATVTYNIGENVDDGLYYIRITENGTFVDDHPYHIQAYSFNIETDRSAYLVGDEMKIFWTANNLKDQSLPPDGLVTLKIWNETHLMKEEFHTNPAGSTSFRIHSSVDKGLNYWIEGWFNDTLNIRHQKATVNFTVQSLGFSVKLDKSQYTLGALMFIDITTFVTTNQSSVVSPLSVAPGCEVTINVYERNDYIQPLILIGPFITDTHGKFQYILNLDDGNFSDNEVYRLDIKAIKHDEVLNSWSRSVDFTITQYTPVSLVLNLDSDRYTSGETMRMNVSAFATSTGTLAVFTYIYEVRDTSAVGTLFARETKDNSTFSYDIPDNFVGTLWILVTVDDGQGNTESKTRLVSVDYALVLVNLDRVSYLAGDNITVSYEVISAVMDDPDIFYAVRDDEGVVVEEGTVATTVETEKNDDGEELPLMSGEFNFLVPSVPSNSYQFIVYASQDGTIVNGTNSASLYRGYRLLISFNRNVYGPGDTMAVDYEILALGDSIIPSNFILTFGLLNGPKLTYQTSTPTGQLLYTIPEDIDQGSQIFNVNSDIGIEVSEVIIIQDNANPLWHTRIFDMPVIIIFMLLAVLFCLFLVLRQRKVVNELRYNKLVDKPKKPAEFSTAAGDHESALGSPMTVSCLECEKPIEVTTARRPIELMCPHCGEIQLLED